MEDQRKQRLLGVTLFELMVTLAILSIGAVIAVPSLAQLIKQTRVTAEANALLRDLRMARQRAVQTRQRVIVCPADANGKCLRQNWRHGWTVFRDTSPSSPVAIGSPGQIARLHQQRNRAIRLSSKRDYFLFSPLGGAMNGTIQICSADSSVVRNVIISNVGRVRVSRNPPPNHPAGCSISH